MNKDNNHIEPIRELSLEKMRAYVEGRLSSQEQHQVEKYLLNHPFEAEAMEGYLDNPDALNELPSLKAQLEARTTDEQKLRVVPMWRKALPYAAVFLLLIISSVLVINFYQKDDSCAPLAIKSEEAVKFDKQENSAKVPTPVQSESIKREPNNQASSGIASNDSEFKQEKELPIQTVQDKEHLAQDELISIEEDLIASETAVPYEDSFQELNEDTLDGKLAEIEIDQNISSAARSKKVSDLASSIAPTDDETVITARKKNATPPTISGEVLDAETGEPLPGANVMIKGTAISTSTDLEGSFEIAANINDVLTVNYIGMEQQEIVVNEEADNTIFLKPDVTQLSEVVVTQNGTDTEQDNTYSASRPSIGFSDYRDYLKDNLRYPSKAREEGTEGRVRLKLGISANGKIREVEVLKGLGDGCDEEAIRLIKEGPRWEPAKKGNTPVASSKKISVRFKIH